ncbi:hypothetical protein, partial [Sphingobacterium sp. 40-24]|uniref:hypothetical protein n=1 Tax=Sphingobacterium sp. 40-24 TaxID=1895843 RepID=UPI00257D2468
CCVPTSRGKRNGIVNSKGGIVRPERCKGHSSLCFCPIEDGGHTRIRQRASQPSPMDGAGRKDGWRKDQKHRAA